MQDYQMGGLYVAPLGGGKFSVAKVLALDSRGVHLRIYSNVLNARPHQLNEAHLTIDGLDNVIPHHNKKHSNPIMLYHPLFVREYRFVTSTLA